MERLSIEMEENYGVTKKSLPLIPKLISPLISIFLDSLKIIFLDYPKLFLIIYVSSALPLSILLTSLSIPSTPRRHKAYMMHLEWLSRVVPLAEGEKNVWSTSQAELRKLNYYRLLHALPVLMFSLVTVVFTVTITSLARGENNEIILAYATGIIKRPSLRAIFTVLRPKWTWPVLTCIVNSFLWIVYGHVLPMLTTVVGYPTSVVVAVVDVVVQVYVMAVLGLALVVSIEEERTGLGVIRAGFDLMKGRRVCGWILSGLILLGTNCIGYEMVGLMDGQDWALEMRAAYMIGLVLLLGWVILWSNVVFAVFYCNLRKINVKNTQAEEKELGDEIEI